MRSSRYYEWHDLKKREWAYTLAGLFMIVNLVIQMVEFSAPRFLISLLFVLGVLGAVGIYYVSFLCPRCRRRFFHVQHPDNGKCCIHCRLTKWSPHDTFYPRQDAI
jgi:hypothetical protein